jgi:hypothetical protein
MEPGGSRHAASPITRADAALARRPARQRSAVHGPRTAAGKARSCLNALRQGRRARDLRAKIARTDDSEAPFLLDWFHDRILLFCQPRNERTWRYTVRLAAPGVVLYERAEPAAQRSSPTGDDGGRRGRSESEACHQVLPIRVR